eukprot:CAMPEP_0172307414 /NCGR_PEP_ID=MMETSP1058-20130122/8287_1 /TAXON_ID=83371 /ORGANISM="Detonula confervacea, Strain CCMP 353" /LENGTH=618 /DNA_ID=CAMNT_0013019579 /DNA_START=178 /DNA_END=2034 /DNA_ORIENTATION=-
MPSSHSSIRLRRPRSSISTAPPKRCSSVVSIASVASFSSAVDEDGAQIDTIDTSEGGGSFRNFLTFDSLNLQSTSYRNKRMLTSVKAESIHQGVSSKISYIPHYGVDVCFIPQRFHYTKEELEPYRKIGDPEMDELLQYLSQNKDAGCGCGAFDDVIAYAAKEYQNNGTTLSPTLQFYKHYYEDVPNWVDFDQIQRGIDVFLAYLPVAGCALFYRSLVGGFSIPRIVEVLSATRYLVPSHLASNNKSVGSVESIARDRKRSEERLIDTGGFLACCFAPLAPTDSEENNVPTAASLRPGGKGWEAALRVRVLHAKVRRSLLQSKKAGSDGKSIPRWDTERNGIPINQEDLAATLLAFSVNVLWGIEIIVGKPLPEKEQRDYLALWRYLGWLLGVDTLEKYDGKITSSNTSEHNHLMPIDPCGPRKLNGIDDEGRCGSFESKPTGVDPDNDSIIHAYATLESMILHLLHPEQNSRELVTHLLSLRRFFVFRSEVCRKFLGGPLSDELHIPKSSMNWKGWRKESIHNFVSHVAVKFFLYFFLLFLRCYTVLTMKFPWIRRRAIVWHAYLETKFMQAWEKMHAKRMTKAEASAEEKVAEPKPSTKQSHCPFSMIMAPKTKDV